MTWLLHAELALLVLAAWVVGAAVAGVLVRLLLQPAPDEPVPAEQGEVP